MASVPLNAARTDPKTGTPRRHLQQTLYQATFALNYPLFQLQQTGHLVPSDFDAGVQRSKCQVERLASALTSSH